MGVTVDVRALIRAGRSYRQPSHHPQSELMNCVASMQNSTQARPWTSCGLPFLGSLLNLVPPPWCGHAHGPCASMPFMLVDLDVHTTELRRSSEKTVTHGNALASLDTCVILLISNPSPAPVPPRSSFASPPPPARSRAALPVDRHTEHPIPRCPAGLTLSHRAHTMSGACGGQHYQRPAASRCERETSVCL